MTFNSYETSRTLGEPDNLYRFTIADQVMAYTDSEETVTFLGVDYLPIPIDRDGVTSSGSLDKVDVKIQLPHDSAVSNLFRSGPPSEIVGVTIFQGHADDPDGEFLTVFAGKVLSRALEDSTATLTCQPISSSMKRPGLRRNYMYGCPHALYGDQCKADRASFSFDVTVVSATSNQVVLAPNWWSVSGQSASKFVGGIAQWTYEGRPLLRTILRAPAESQTIVLNGAADGLVTGTTITLSLGCNHLLLNGGDCGGVFDNAVNYGGQPWIPTINPIGSVNRFY